MSQKTVFSMCSWSPANRVVPSSYFGSVFVYPVCESFRGEAEKEQANLKDFWSLPPQYFLNCFKVIGSHWHAENVDHIGAFAPRFQTHGQLFRV